MVAITPTKTEKAPRWLTTTWAGVAPGDTCVPVKVDQALFAYSVQASGTFGSATVALHGSLDGTNYVALADASGTAIGLTAAGLASGGQLALYLKPVLSGGSGSAVNITVMTSYLL